MIRFVWADFWCDVLKNVLFVVVVASLFGQGGITVESSRKTEKA